MSIRCRTLAAALLALLAAAPVTAQSTRLGLKAGLTSATITGDDAEGAESLNGFSGGVFATFQLSPGLAIQPEALYMSKGASLDVVEADGVAEIKLRYIEIPLLLKYTFGTGPLRPSLFGGPAIAFQASCEVEVSDGGVTGSFDCDDDELDIAVFKDTDFGGILGVGFDYDLGAAALIADARLGLGLVSIDDTGQDADAKNRAWSFLVGASFPVGGR